MAREKKNKVIPLASGTPVPSSDETKTHEPGDVPPAAAADTPKKTGATSVLMRISEDDRSLVIQAMRSELDELIRDRGLLILAAFQTQYNNRVEDDPDNDDTFEYNVGLTVTLVCKPGEVGVAVGAGCKYAMKRKHFSAGASVQLRLF